MNSEYRELLRKIIKNSRDYDEVVLCRELLRKNYINELTEQDEKLLKDMQEFEKQNDL